MLKLAKVNINNSNTRTLLDLEIIPGTGEYIILAVTPATSGNIGSLYYVRFSESTRKYTLATIKEGESVYAPRITPTGIIRINESASFWTVTCIVFKC